MTLGVPEIREGLCTGFHSRWRIPAEEGDREEGSRVRAVVWTSERPAPDVRRAGQRSSLVLLAQRSLLVDVGWGEHVGR